MVVDGAEPFEQRDRLRKRLNPLDGTVGHVYRRLPPPTHDHHVGPPLYEVADHVIIPACGGMVQ